MQEIIYLTNQISQSNPNLVCINPFFIAGLLIIVGVVCWIVGSK